MTSLCYVWSSQHLFFHVVVLPLCGSYPSERAWHNNDESFKSETNNTIVLHSASGQICIRILKVLNAIAYTPLRQFWAHLFKWTLWVGRWWPQTEQCAFPSPEVARRSSSLFSVHEHGWSEPAKTTPGEEQKPAGRPLNTRTAEQVVDVRSLITVIDVISIFRPVWRDSADVIAIACCSCA